MDPVTQTALGAAVGGCFRPRLGGRAVLVGAACGFAPDLDVLAGLAGEFASLVHHRGLTHSLPALAAVSPAVGWLARRWSRTGTLAAWTHLVFWALVTHPLLDWCTTYGTQLLLPFTDRRFGVDAVAVIDPLATLPLLIAVAVNLRRKISAGRQAAWSAAMLAAFVAYLGLGYVQSARAVSLAERQLAASGIPDAEVRAPATMFNVWLRRVVVRPPDGRLLVGHVSTFAPRPIRFAEAEGLRGPLREEVLATEEGRIFVWFADGLVAVELSRDAGGGEIVTLSDQRYGMLSRPLASPFRARAVRGPNGTWREWRRTGRETGEVARELRLLWTGILGGEVSGGEAEGS